MIDTKLIRKNINLIFNELNKRNIKLNIEEFQIKDKKRKNIQKQLEKLLSDRRKISKFIGIYKISNKNTEKLFEDIKFINNKIEILKNDFIKIKKYINNFLYEIPNILSNDVPYNINEKNDLEIYKWGEKKTFNFNVKDHLTIGSINNNLNFKLASKISGCKFVVMKNKIAKINRALIQLMLDYHTKNGYEEINVPLISNYTSLYGTGQLPKFKEDIFYISKFNSKLKYALIPTSEVPLINIIRNTIIDEKTLPIKMVSYTPCFRSEVGSYGNNEHGLIRLHQFDKVELVRVVKPEDSFHALEDLTKDAENILKLLNLPYRKILLCAENTPFSSCKTYDLEVWFPSKNKYIEVSSCSNTSDFQSRRIFAKYKNNKLKKNILVHTLNGSGLAISRTLAAIIENYQDKDMNINIPSILNSYINNI